MQSAHIAGRSIREVILYYQVYYLRLELTVSKRVLASSLHDLRFTSRSTTA